MVYDTWNTLKRKLLKSRLAFEQKEEDSFRCPRLTLTKKPTKTNLMKLLFSLPVAQQVLL
jgi:hypothetical protein